MRSITLFLFCCAIYGQNFSQSPTGYDSIKTMLNGTNQAEKNSKQKSLAELIIYPNPVKNKITIQVKNFKPGMVSVKVLDLKGKVVKEHMRLLTNGSEDIIMFLMLKAGIYFIVVSQPGKEARKKISIL